MRVGNEVKTMLLEQLISESMAFDSFAQPDIIWRCFCWI